MTGPVETTTAIVDGHKVEIYLFAGLLAEICDSIEAVLVERDGELFQRAGAIYWKSLHGVVKVDAELLRVRSMRVADFLKPIPRKLSYEPIDPPLKYFHAFLRKGEWKFPELDEPTLEAGR